MTTEKDQGHQCPLAERVRNIESDVRDIKGMVAGMYDRFGDLVDTAEATYRTVSRHETDSTSPPDNDWGFLDDEE